MGALERRVVPREESVGPWRGEWPLERRVLGPLERRVLAPRENSIREERFGPLEWRILSLKRSVG